MKVLFLGNSTDEQSDVAPDALRHRVIAREIEARTGEPVEMVIKRAWPNEKFPAIVERWVREERPDVVYLNVIAFWFCYESVPLRVERLLGPLGRPCGTGRTPRTTSILLYRAWERHASRGS